MAHGAGDEYFLDFFADKGYRALGVSLRGHGESPTPKPLRRCSWANYVDDVYSVADGLPTRPAVIGHSLGGYVVQRYLESFAAPAGVLVASMPPQGALGVLLRLTRRHALLMATAMITGKSLPCVNTPERARESFFSAEAPESHVVARLQEESQRACLDALLFGLPRPKRVTTPMLVLGAEDDGCFSTREVRATARAYRTEAEIFPGIGHNMMLEQGWPAVAERIHTWLDGRGL